MKKKRKGLKIVVALVATCVVSALMLGVLSGGAGSLKVVDKGTSSTTTADITDPTESAEPTESTEVIEATEPTESTEATEVTEPTETPDSSLISFTVDGTEYQAEEGMTWEEWCDNSEYNTDGYSVQYNGGVYGVGLNNQFVAYSGGTWVSPSVVITEDNYVLSAGAETPEETLPSDVPIDPDASEDPV